MRVNGKKAFHKKNIFCYNFPCFADWNNSGQSESGQDTIGQIEGNSGKDSTAGLAGESAAEEQELGEETESKILIAYFSRVGNMNFDKNIDAVTSASVNMNGSNVSGNAQMLTEMVRKVTGGDLFFIETVEKYPAKYRGTTDQAKTEQNDDTRPKLSSHVENMDAYDTVILIYAGGIIGLNKEKPIN